MTTDHAAAGPLSPVLRIVRATHELTEATLAYRDQLAARPDLEARQLIDQLEGELRQVSDLAHAVGLYFDDLPRGTGMAPAISLLTILQDKVTAAQQLRNRAFHVLADAA